MAADEEFVWAVKSEGHLVTNKAGGSARTKARQLRDADPLRAGLARLLRKHTDERAWRIGADAEESVGSRLDRLDRTEWLVLHDIVLNESGTNVDHLVIGPAGVFSLNTKHHPKKKVVVTERGFRVNGYRTNYLQAAVAEAARVGKVLRRHLAFSVFVHPVIVVVGAELEVRKMPVDVSVIRRKELPKWFRRLPAVLPAEQVKELRAVAGRPATWRPAEELVVRAWSRYGKKRTYVNTVEGETLGWHDELTGQVHVEDAEDLERVRGALGAHTPGVLQKSRGKDQPAPEGAMTSYRDRSAGKAMLIPDHRDARNQLDTTYARGRLQFPFKGPLLLDS